MTSDLPLFMETPVARRKDPDTSQLAAGWLRKSGTLAHQEAIVLAALQAHPGVTSQELAQYLPHPDRYITCRRLAGLADKGLVHRGPKRFCTVSHMACITWQAGKQSIGTPPVRPQATRASCESRVPVPVTSPSERQRLRDRLAASGDPSTRKFLAGLDGRGGAK